MSQTHYATLGVSETATQDEIKRAYRRLAKKYHPDHNKKKGAEEKFKEINLANQVLGDPSRRQIYDYDLNQSRKAGAASGSGSAGASAPPPPPPPSSGFSSGAGSHAAPPPPAPSAQGAYRYLFFFRGVLVGGIAIGFVLVLTLTSYVACHASSARPVQSAPPEPVLAETEHEPVRVPVISEGAPTEPEPIPAIPEPTATILESTPTQEPDPPTQTPTPVAPEPTLTAEPTPPAPEPTPVPSPVHLCGEWRGTFEWLGTAIRFTMRLEQREDEISGTWTETNNRRLWRATIRGRVDGSTVTLVKTYVDTGSTVSLVSSDSSSELLRGTWETPQSRGSWQATWEGELGAKAERDRPQDDSWRRRPARHRSSAP